MHQPAMQGRMVCLNQIYLMANLKDPASQPTQAFHIELKCFMKKKKFSPFLSKKPEICYICICFEIFHFFKIKTNLESQIFGQSIGLKPGEHIVQLILTQFRLKFIYSEKATHFCEISTSNLSYVVTVEISQNFVAFSEYMNFIKLSV